MVYDALTFHAKTLTPKKNLNLKLKKVSSLDDIAVSGGIAGNLQDLKAMETANAGYEPVWALQN